MLLYSSTDRLRVRDLTLGDIPLINAYWAGQTSEDIRRLSLDPTKIPVPAIKVDDFLKMEDVPLPERTSHRLMWELNGEAVGMNSMGNLRYGESGEIHLHMLNPQFRRSGYGHRFFAMALNDFFQRFSLKLIICQPSAENPGPNRLLQKLGFSVAKTYRTIPSPINREHLVNRYEILRDHEPVIGEPD